MTPGRNDPCPCGSGRKFKHCHGALPAAERAQHAPRAAPEPRREPDPAALGAMLRQGRFAEVESWAARLLERDPDSGVLWKILGVARAQAGRDGAAELRKAARLMPHDVEAHRNLGAVLKEQGQFAEALASLERVLGVEPQDLNVLIAAADCLCALGRAREALPLYERALRLDPRLADAHNNLGNALQELGEHARAVECYRRALALTPNDAELHANLGNALRQLGQVAEALASLERAIALNPKASLAHNHLGLALAACGRTAEAVASLRRAVELNPRSAQTLDNLGNALCDAADYGAAVEAYRRAVELDPRRADFHSHLGRALYELGLPAESIASYGRALELEPQDGQARLGRATALRLAGRSEEAEALCRALLEREPEHVGALSLLGDLYADHGDFVRSGQLLERALATGENSAAVLCSIAAQRRMTAADGAWLEQAAQVLGKPLPLAHEIALRYALGKCYDDLGRYAEAFESYSRANELSARHTAPYDRVKLTQHVDDLIASFDAAFAASAHAGGSDSELPVFIVGMPRSGTTLAEQILASHPQALGVGEVSFWEPPAERFRRAIPGSEARAAVLAAAARDYLALIGSRAGPALRVIDKMPANFLCAGLIHAAFPRARLLHMQRHPLDTCLSLYFQNFGDRHPYANELGNLAHYYGEYLRLTRHWRAVLPAATLLEVPYEALVEDQEYWTRRMLDFIGLPWDARCLEFHRTERVVITASRWQVRQKINRASVERWRNYAPHLAALRPLLSPVTQAPSPRARPAPP